MSDDDLIRRGDALAEIRRIFNGYPNWVTDAIAALPPAKQDDLASGKAVTVSAADLLKDVPRYNGWNDYNPSKIMYEADVLAALEHVAAPDPALRPTMTDMMVDPDMLDAFMEANPLPPDPAPTDPAAIREAALRELREVMDILESHGAAGEAIADEIAAPIQKGDTDDRA